jgi:transcriptional regulator with XRE-family HTH domain
LENGKRPARLSTIRKLADALGVEPRELMKGENDE